MIGTVNVTPILEEGYRRTHHFGIWIGVRGHDMADDIDTKQDK